MKTNYWFYIALLITVPLSAHAERPVFHLEIKQNLFYPSTLEVPANQKFKLVITNHDNTPEEFDSFDLNREKVIYPQSSATIYVGPLPSGVFHFFGEYHPSTATGLLIAKPSINVLKESDDVN